MYRLFQALLKTILRNLLFRIPPAAASHRLIMIYLPQRQNVQIRRAESYRYATHAGASCAPWWKRMMTRFSILATISLLLSAHILYLRRGCALWRRFTRQFHRYGVICQPIDIRYSSSHIFSCLLLVLAIFTAIAWCAASRRVRGRLYSEEPPMMICGNEASVNRTLKKRFIAKIQRAHIFDAKIDEANKSPTINEMTHASLMIINTLWGHYLVICAQNVGLFSDLMMVKASREVLFYFTSRQLPRSDEQSLLVISRIKDW